MSIALSLPLLLVSFLLIGVVTQRYFLPSLENVAAWLKLRENIAGATLLAFGSSAPELFTASLTLVFLQGTASFGVGSIVGSALFQILVVIGFAALVRPGRLRWRPVVRDGAVYAAAVALLFFFARDGAFTVAEGGVLVGSYGMYLGLLAFWSRHVPRSPEEPSETEDGADEGAEGAVSAALSRLSVIALPVEFLLRPIPDPRERPKWTVPVFLLSLVVIGGGAYLFVRAGEDVALFLGVDPAIVALTVIAGGSSVPELVASAVVAQQGKHDMAVANALGSNTFDILVSLGFPVLLATLVHGRIEGVGGPGITSSILLLLATLVLVVGLLALQKFRTGRIFGTVLLLSYAFYVVAAYRGWIG
ncbi:MAG TPA: hypothetical protein VGR37_13985 [Longimicrobiaceae bacterium]|nr:hypothetical protein [Longimicrobiaceae bacterium]